MSDSYDDYEAKIQLAEHAWEVKTEHDRAVELGKAYERGWNAALAGLTQCADSVYCVSREQGADDETISEGKRQ